ncbi:MAG: hypothetical protein ACI8ZB_003136 [Desulforhopalus sp.]|jgi:hypothetical protein
MKKAKKDHEPVVTKVIVDKIHAGREHDSKFGQSEFDNEEVSKPNLVRGRSEFNILRFVLFFLLFSFVIQLFLIGFVYYKPGVFPTLTNFRPYKIACEYLNELTSGIGVKIVVPAKDSGEIEGKKEKLKEYSFSQNQITKAKRQVLDQKKVDSSANGVVKRTNESKSKVNENVEYRYEIEFISGGRLQTNNAIIADNIVTFENKKGLVVSVSKDEILSMKRTVVKRRANATKFRCSGKIHCSQMTSCEEAKFYLRNCPGTKLDGDRDGKPCEEQWCGN